MAHDKMAQAQDAMFKELTEQRRQFSEVHERLTKLERGEEVRHKNPMAVDLLSVEHNTEEKHVSEIHEHDDKGRNHELEESVWDTSIFLFHPRLGGLVSGLACWWLVVNVIVQVVLALVVIDSLTSPEFDSTTVHDLRAWRTGVAQL